jgi:general secretion pathway protein E
MGVEDYLVASTVNGVLAQRLVRKLCVHCREPYRAMPELVAQLRLPAADGETTLYRPRGCEQCQGSGYLGRIAILEFLGLSEEIRRLVLRRAPEQEVHRAAAEAGMQSMYEDGMRKVVQGLTSVEDVLRVTRDFG